jgi:hypothetical protein
MPKRTEAAEPKGAQSSSEMIKAGALDKLVKAVSVANDKMDTGRQNKSELIRDACESDNLHKGAFGWFMKMRKMDPVRRNEWLAHFEYYCEWGKFTREDLFTEPEGTASTAEDDDAKDFRPTHLKQPGASAAEDAVQKIKEDALNKVGRGKPDASKLQ